MVCHHTNADDLRNLLGVARKLRALAHDTAGPSDQELYLTAASALEARAHWLAETLPEDRVERDEAQAHRPVNLLI